jgi:hypothetical protein
MNTNPSSGRGLQSRDAYEPHWEGQYRSDVHLRNVARLTFVFSLPALFPLSAESAAWGLALLWAVPTAYGVWNSRSLVPQDPMYLVGAMYVLGFALPVLAPQLYLDVIWTSLPEVYLDSAVLWSYRGTAAMCIAYSLYRLYGTQKRVTLFTQREFSSGDRIFCRLIAVLGLIGGALSLLLSGGRVYVFTESGGAAAATSATVMQIVQYLHLLSFAYIYLFRCQYTFVRHTIGSIERTLLALILGLHLMFIVGAGGKGIVLSLVILTLLPVVNRKARFGMLRQLIASAVVVATVFGTFQVITNYREIVRTSPWVTDAGILGVLEFQIVSFAEAVTASIDKAIGDHATVPFGEILDRFGYLASFARVLYFSDQTPPFEHALESFFVPFYAIVPRFLIDKPIFFGSGHLAALEGWEFGGISVTLIGSFYWAWGYGGIIAGMGVVGLVLAWVDRKRRSAVRGWAQSAVLYAIVVLLLLDAGLIFQAIVIDIIRFALALWAASALLNYRAGRGPW